MNKFFNIVATASAAVLLGLLSIDGSYADSAISGSSSNGIAAAAGNNTNTAVTVQAAPVPTDTTLNLKNVPNISTPGLTTTLTETCMGSWSVGGAISGFGIGGGKTEVDTRCANRLDARELRTWNEQDVAKEVMCGTPEVRAAYKRVGRPCINDQKQADTTADGKKLGTGIKDEYVRTK